MNRFQSGMVKFSLSFPAICQCNVNVFLSISILLLLYCICALKSLKCVCMRAKLHVYDRFKLCIQVYHVNTIISQDIEFRTMPTTNGNQSPITCAIPFIRRCGQCVFRANRGEMFGIRFVLFARYLGQQI